MAQDHEQTKQQSREGFVNSDSKVAAVSRSELRELPPMPSPSKHPIQAAAWWMQTCLALAFLTALLAIAATIPLIHVLVLGYLVKIQGRVARTGKLRSAFYLLPAARRLGTVGLAVWIWLLPIGLLAGIVRDSWILAPGEGTTWIWTLVLVVVSLLIAIHLLLAIACGGGAWRFARPLSNARWMLARWRAGGYSRQAHQAISRFVAAIRVLELLRLGTITYIAAYLWVTIPAFLFTMIDDVTSRLQIAAFLIGGVALTAVLLWLPWLLAHVAAVGRPRAMFELATVGKLTRKRPLGWATSTAILYACSILPMLYVALLKNTIPPHSARWDVMLVFLVTVVPARMLVGRVYHSATAAVTQTPTWPRRLWYVASAIALCVGVGYYVYFLYLAQTGGELGQRAVWQFHAVLQPWPTH